MSVKKTLIVTVVTAYINSKTWVLRATQDLGQIDFHVLKMLTS